MMGFGIFNSFVVVAGLGAVDTLGSFGSFFLSIIIKSILQNRINPKLILILSAKFYRQPFLLIIQQLIPECSLQLSAHYTDQASPLRSFPQHSPQMPPYINPIPRYSRQYLWLSPLWKIYWNNRNRLTHLPTACGIQQFIERLKLPQTANSSHSAGIFVSNSQKSPVRRIITQVPTVSSHINLRLSCAMVIDSYLNQSAKPLFSPLFYKTPSLSALYENSLANRLFLQKPHLKTPTSVSLTPAEMYAVYTELPQRLISIHSRLSMLPINGQNMVDHQQTNLSSPNYKYINSALKCIIEINCWSHNFKSLIEADQISKLSQQPSCPFIDLINCCEQRQAIYADITQLISFNYILKEIECASDRSSDTKKTTLHIAHYLLAKLSQHRQHQVLAKLAQKDIRMGIRLPFWVSYVAREYSKSAQFPTSQSNSQKKVDQDLQKYQFGSQKNRDYGKKSRSKDEFTVKDQPEQFLQTNTSGIKQIIDALEWRDYLFSLVDQQPQKDFSAEPCSQNSEGKIDSSSKSPPVINNSTLFQRCPSVCPLVLCASILQAIYNNPLLVQSPSKGTRLDKHSLKVTIDKIIVGLVSSQQSLSKETHPFSSNRVKSINIVSLYKQICVVTVGRILQAFGEAYPNQPLANGKSNSTVSISKKGQKLSAGKGSQMLNRLEQFVNSTVTFLTGKELEVFSSLVSQSEILQYEYSWMLEITRLALPVQVKSILSQHTSYFQPRHNILRQWGIIKNLDKWLPMHWDYTTNRTKHRYKHIHTTHSTSKNYAEDAQ